MVLLACYMYKISNQETFGFCLNNYNLTVAAYNVLVFLVCV